MASEISYRVTQLFREITSDLYSNSPTPAGPHGSRRTGAFIFLPDLVRQIKLLILVYFICVDSYGAGIESTDAPRLSLHRRSTTSLL
ncbi:unnamed protein product [Linum tenue]|uniref:Uncharacterized protein n=1 Tax=Linum tenue TaxID=586396 RepID=A0AAV0Q8D3_9ROSI|nr:unnamed protein product [Linum tenue]